MMEVAVLKILFLFSISLQFFLINSFVAVSSSPAPTAIEKNIQSELLRAKLELGLEWRESFTSLRTTDKKGQEEEDSKSDPNAIIPTVSTPLGKVIGKALKSRAGRVYYAFLGIPYTQKPKRFQPATLIEKFDGLSKVLDARKEGSMCPQPDESDGVRGKEDCLFLNIYYPHEDLCQNVTESGKLPVMYNIHGGSFTVGYGSYFNPQYLMDECIVFVSVNYRLGALGFLTTEDGLIPGNLGLKDQVVGLQFVNKYISYFRGDKDLVTALGISAGGSSTSHLVTSPTTKGLIHRAIASSGNVMNPWSITENPGETAKALGRNLLCSTKNSASLKSCLERASVKDIVTQQSKTSELVPFTPVIEVETEKNPFQNRNPAVLLRNGDFNRIPLMAGFVKDEGIGLIAGSILNSLPLIVLFNTMWNFIAPSVFQYHRLGLSEEKKNEISEKIRDFYFGDNLISQETRQNLTDLCSDRFFAQGTFELVQLHSKFAPAYSYVLSYKGGNTFATSAGYEIPAVTHGDDAQYLFSSFENFQYGTEQYELSKNMVKLWTSFAATGKPTGIEPTSNSWKVSEGRSNANWFDLDVPTKTLVNYLERRRSFWENVGIYEKEYY